MGFLIVIVVLFAVMWLFLIRPQRRRQLQQESMIGNLEEGDEILTAGGLYGFVRGVAADEVTLEIAPGTNVRVAKRAVATVLTEDEDDEDPTELEAAEVEEAEGDSGPAGGSAEEAPHPRESDRPGTVPS